MTEKHYRNNNICRFGEKENFSDRVRDHCHLTVKFRGPAQNKCSIILSHEHSNFLPFVFYNIGNYDCQLFFKKLFDSENDKLKFDEGLRTNEKDITVTHGCIRFSDGFRFFSCSLYSLVETLVDIEHKTL